MYLHNNNYREVEEWPYRCVTMLIILPYIECLVTWVLVKDLVFKNISYRSKLEDQQLMLFCSSTTTLIWENESCSSFNISSKAMKVVELFSIKGISIKAGFNSAYTVLNSEVLVWLKNVKICNQGHLRNN